jgi:CRISPR system Cascade subunit CasD
MNEYLIFRIYGMMASWGDIAVGEFRPSFDRPSKSAIMGMVAAALGIRRDEEERLRELATGYCMAVRIDAPGILMRDYHTAQVPSSGKTILSSRDYRCDAVYSVCLWSRTASPPYPLTVLKQHLENPVFGLYLGRKSCPLALPLQPQVIPAESISGALSSAHFKDAPFIARLESDSDVRIFWEGDMDAGFPSVHTVQRRDDPLSRKRWQFGNRTEHSAMIRKPAGV